MKFLLILCLLSLVVPAFPQQAGYHDVIIDEIMAHPIPGSSLPNAEFVELKNISATAINLNGWKLADAGSQGSISTGFLLQPDSFVLLCSTSSLPLLSAWGRCVAVTSFPSLNNDGDQLILKSREGRAIHAVAYTAAWYGNTVKELGGWTLEMIDTGNPCGGPDNWTASTAAAGGTPGKKNAVAASHPDGDLPELLRAYATDSSILLSFNETLDSTSAANPGDYSIDDPVVKIQSAQPLAPFFDRVLLRCSRLAGRHVYTVTVKNIRDCSGNGVGAAHTARAGLAGRPAERDIVINEVLFHPLPDGTDYVELYNRSDSLIDISRLFIANRSSAGVLGSVKQLGSESRLLFPGDYLLVSDNEQVIKRQYLAKDPAAFITLPSLPSIPNDKGNIVLLTDQGAVIDELGYSEQWQFALLSSTAGVALERINYNGTTQDPGNWHSAAATAGLGTPGYRNSQAAADPGITSAITLTPSVFSPDNDGYNDFLTVSYLFPSPGNVANVSVYNAAGHQVRLLARNVLCGAVGAFRWDGLDDQQGKLPAGVYVLLTEVFNTTGSSQRFKNTVILARKL